ncbi:MAG: hypothetical protein PVF11_12160 [Desulfobacterales bacterium]|jgi:hypothetical protein
MLKRRSIVLYVLLIAALGCAHTSNNVEAEETNLKLGDNTLECKFLNNDPKDPPTAYIKVIRDKEQCIEEVTAHSKPDCSDGSVIERLVKTEGKIPPPEIASGFGNQKCGEAVLFYKKSPYCVLVRSGGRSFYVGPG